MEIYLIRHTTPEVETGICYGQTDLRLKDSFEEEWAEIKNKIPDYFDSVFCSTAIRCQLLAEKLKTKTLKHDHRLKELNFGDWEMKKWAELEGSRYQDWLQDFVHAAPPNGESFFEMSQRVQECFKEVELSESEKIAIVAHGGSIRIILAYILELDLKNTYNMILDYGKISRIDIENQTKKVKFINL